MKFEEFKEMFEEFVSDNFIADDCRECHEVCHSIVPDDFKIGKKESSYDTALKKLYKDWII